MKVYFVNGQAEFVVAAVWVPVVSGGAVVCGPGVDCGLSVVLSFLSVFFSVSFASVFCAFVSSGSSGSSGSGSGAPSGYGGSGSPSEPAAQSSVSQSFP